MFRNVCGNLRWAITGILWPSTELYSKNQDYKGYIEEEVTKYCARGLDAQGADKAEVRSVSSSCSSALAASNYQLFFGSGPAHKGGTNPNEPNHVTIFVRTAEGLYLTQQTADNRRTKSFHVYLAK